MLDPPRVTGRLTGTEKSGGQLDFGGWIWPYDLSSSLHHRAQLAAP